MNRVLRVLIVFVLFEIGVFLLLVPWLSAWDHNWFLIHYPSLIHILLHPSFRGMVSGLGLLDMVIAVTLLRRPARVAEAPAPGEFPPAPDQPPH